MPWPVPGDSSINSRLTGTVPDQSRGIMSSGVVTQGNVTNISSSQIPGVGGHVSSCKCQWPRPVPHKPGKIHLCQIRELLLDNQLQVCMRVGSQSCQMYGSQGVPPSPVLFSTHRSQLPSLIPPGSRSGISRRNPTEVKCVRYNGDVEWGPFYSTIAEQYGWCDADCLFALSLTQEGVALKYFDILRRRG